MSKLITSKKLKIVFATCPSEGEVRDRVTHKFFKNKAVKYLPLGILSIAANIQHHKVIIIDAASRGLSIDETLNEIESLQPDILGLSAVTYRAWSMTEILRRCSVPIKVVGGPHATHNYQTILSNGAHAVFTGDAEETFPTWLKNNCSKGVFYGKPSDINKIPLPARHLVNLADYSIKDSSNLLFDAGRLRMQMFSSKGCPNRCSYCDVQQKIYITKDPERILQEFIHLKNLGATSIHILDDTFNLQKKRVLDFCNQLNTHSFQLDWSIRGNVETNETVIKALAAAGCKRFHAGIEHFDDTILKNFRKNHRLRDIKSFCELCMKHNIAVLGYFIIGAPGESQRYREKLPEEIKKLGIKFPFFNVLTPLNNTEFYREILRNGSLKNDFWGDFSKNPVRNFEIPSHRSSFEETEIQETLASYISLYN